jgi:hypothetical protein
VLATEEIHSHSCNVLAHGNMSIIAQTDGERKQIKSGNSSTSAARPV